MLSRQFLSFAGYNSGLVISCQFALKQYTETQLQNDEEIEFEEELTKSQSKAKIEAKAREALVSRLKRDMRNRFGMKSQQMGLVV